ncbi:MFS transporter [Streptantibioticus cattleyicolor]|uniref:Major facilitator superfamily permease n=1 Tax=Streptantibioticus cattleyicolor (strain ATCC 35852 / DSM 46488 / JCM 4925 / NBRC 14057 / NRRL 8057) TaxID=1003195 RepID=F8JKQ6_STREN|nr:MFS transporter [Streptantibioticus cattleyicolor]AEW98452.1 major facilitator superfamily permease [Streptantibioticus cattleyicolor NRRL 8057 = DSM 46488]CCB72492.1 putative permease of the major facilitator superfamily [Streptantibioticus cattleyicolor NRRL 8057 = DSM 46488]
MTDDVLTEPASAEEGLFSKGYAAATVSFAAVNVLTGLAALAVVPTLPIAVRGLHGLWLYPLVASAFVAASLLGGVIGGNWADRSGAGRPLATGLVLAVVTLLVSATSVSIWQLAAGRFLDGVSAGMITVCINTAIGQTYPDRMRPRVLALMSASWIGPSLIGPPVAGLVADWWSWRGVFFGLAALTLPPAVAVVVLLRRLSRHAGTVAPEADDTARPGLVVAAAVSLGTALGQYAVTGGGAAHVVCGVVAVALLAGFIRRILPPGTWRAARGLPATVLGICLASGTFFTLEAFVPLLLDTDRRVSPAVTGLVFTGAAIAWAASSWVQSHLLADRPRHQLVAIGAALVAVAAMVAVAGTLPALPPYLSGAALLVAAVGMGMAAPTLTVLSLAHTPPGRQGYASSAMQTSRNLGQITIMAICSALFTAFHQSAHAVPGFTIAFATLAVPSTVLALLAVRTREA